LSRPLVVNPVAMRQLKLIDRIASLRGLDAVAGIVRDATHRVLRPGVAKDLLHGVWLGHPLHPALAQLSVGCFTGAAVLDIRGDHGDGTARLIRWGLAAGLPTAAAGLADYADAHEEQQRIGVVHAAANSAALVSYLASLRLRSAGRTRAGTVAGLVGFALMAGGAMLGGDLSFRRAVGANHAAEVPHTGPEQWCDLGAVEEFAVAGPVRRTAGLIPVLVLAEADGFAVLHDRCSHMAAPLSQGEIEVRDGERCLVCPWHGSVFRVMDGAVVHGPATAPQPVLDSRVVDGRVQAKVRTFPGVPAS
jgi:nitrite reductase/ring-hydroxylating ferredoxin subunit/uncharacterized membrane protein